MPNPTAAALALKLRKGALDPVALVEETLAAIAAYTDQAVFTELTAERALREAKAARRRLRSGSPASLLDGVPIAWKDLFDVKGRVTTAGSILMRSNPPAGADAALVAAGSRAGLLPVGMTNMTEFAYSGIGINPHYGTPWNPTDPAVQRAPGGSSSGSAVAVAAGLLAIAAGTDTGGSIRLPAAFNGITGYKSSTGHYPMAGVFPLARSLDSLGPLAQTVEDCVLFDAAVRGLAKPRAKRRNARDLTILVPETFVFDALDASVAANFDRSLKRIAKAGAKVKRIAFPAFTAIADLGAKHGSLISAEALHLHWERVHGPDAEKMDPRVVRRILAGKKMTGADVIAVQETRARLIAEVNALVGDALIAFPTSARLAMPIAPLIADADEFVRANVSALRLTGLGNFLDWCGLSIPNGGDGHGLATGFMLSARHGRDAELLSAGLTLEAAVRG